MSLTQGHPMNLEEPYQKVEQTCGSVGGASRRSICLDGSDWDRSVMDEAYIPVPFPQHLLEPQEFHDILATLDVCALPRPTQFCDPDGNGIIPIQMLRVYHNLEDSSWDYDSSIEEYYEMDRDPHTSRIAETTDEKSSFMQNHGAERQIGNTSPSKTSLST